jgi:phytoene desaturase
MKKKIVIIGSGFSSLSAASYLAKKGFDVHVFEKNDTLGGTCETVKKRRLHF